MLVESLPILFDDGIATATGFEDIVAYLRNHPTAANHDLDAKLSSRQQTDRTASVHRRRFDALTPSLTSMVAS